MQSSNSGVIGVPSLVEVLDGDGDGSLRLGLFVRVRVEAGVPILGASGQGAAQEACRGHRVSLRVGGSGLGAVVL